jgi:hypothetical protein
MELNQQNIALLLVAILLLIYLYHCIVIVSENKLIIIETWTKRYIKTLSGVKGIRAATEADVAKNPTLELGQLIPGKESSSLQFILYGPYRKARYRKNKNFRKNSEDLKPEDKKLISWGNADEDTQVTLSESCEFDFYWYQDTIELLFDNLETGIAKGKGDHAQNIKMRVRQTITVWTQNPYKTMYKEGNGGKWVEILQDIIMSGLSAIFSTRSYDDISKLRSQKLDEVEIVDGETFDHRVNHHMIDVKDMGKLTGDMMFLDYEISPESQAFLDALAKNAESLLAADTAEADAKALNALLQPELNAEIKLMTAKKKALLELRDRPDQTVVQQAKSLPQNLRVLVGSLHGGSDGDNFKEFKGPKNKKIVNQVVANEIDDEINNGPNQNNNQRRRN